jgi:RNA polymerase-interacting CarD/CdnL/TRCF family regulator
VTLPIARARATLRSTIDVSGLAQVRATLRTENAADSDDVPWSRRLRTTREHVSRGDAVVLAGVVRDGMRREQRLGARGALASSSERELYARARHLLATEISHCRHVEIADAEAWIATQVLGAAPEAAPAAVVATRVARRARARPDRRPGNAR